MRNTASRAPRVQAQPVNERPGSSRMRSCRSRSQRPRAGQAGRTVDVSGSMAILGGIVPTDRAPGAAASSKAASARRNLRRPSWRRVNTTRNGGRGPRAPGTGPRRPRTAPYEDDAELRRLVTRFYRFRRVAVAARSAGLRAARPPESGAIRPIPARFSPRPRPRSPPCDGRAPLPRAGRGAAPYPPIRCRRR